MTHRLPRDRRGRFRRLSRESRSSTNLRQYPESPLHQSQAPYCGTVEPYSCSEGDAIYRKNLSSSTFLTSTSQHRYTPSRSWTLRTVPSSLEIRRRIRTSRYCSDFDCNCENRPSQSGSSSRRLLVRSRKRRSRCSQTRSISESKSRVWR